MGGVALDPKLSKVGSRAEKCKEGTCFMIVKFRGTYIILT